MEWSTLLDGFRVASAVLLVVGLAGVGITAASEVVYYCDPGYAYGISEIQEGATPDDWVAFEDLGEPNRQAFLESLDGTSTVVDTDSDLPGNLNDKTVRYEGQYYSVGFVFLDCGGNPFLFFGLVGVPAALVGTLGLGAARLLGGRWGA